MKAGSITYFAQGGANYIVADKRPKIRAERYGLLVPGQKYLQIGSKRRSSFAWNEPATYVGILSHKGEKYILFNETEDKGKFWYYAFITIEGETRKNYPKGSRTVLQFNNGMKSCSDIVIDTVTQP